MIHAESAASAIVVKRLLARRAHTSSALSSSTAYQSATFASRFVVSYWCANGHEVRPSFAQEETVVIPEEWDCPRCGFPAGQDKNNPPSPIKNEPYKTHLAYVKERRTPAEATKILEDALKKLRGEDLD